MGKSTETSPVTKPSRFTPVAAAGERILEAVDLGVKQRWEPALARAAAATGETIEERVDKLTAAFRQELAVAGGAVGGVAAVPGIGTTASIAASTAEFGWSTVRLADLILSIAAVHGHDSATVEERRLWVLSILAYGNSASTMVTRLAGEAGKGLGKRATAKIPAPALRAINAKIGRTILTKYGTKRGVVALGRAFPFGIGAAIGYGLNAYIVTRTAKSATSFFSKLAIEVEVEA